MLKASNEGNLIVIDIADDGAGIDVNRVRQKAIDRGLIHPNKILSDQEIHHSEHIYVYCYFHNTNMLSVDF